MLERLKGAGMQIVGWILYVSIMVGGVVGIVVWAKPEYAIAVIVIGLLAYIAILMTIVTALALPDDQCLTNRFFS